MNTNIKKWYIANYESDELGLEINDNTTFQDLFNALDSGECVYSVLGESVDSIIRERCFEQLANIMKVDYEDIYDLWLYE